MAASNRFVSYLATEIEPRAFSTLNRFDATVEKAFDKLSRFSDSGSARLGGTIVRSFGAPTQRALAQTGIAAERTRASIERFTPATARLTNEANRMSTALTRSSQALNIVQGPLGPLSGRLSALGDVIQRLTGFSLAGVLAGGSAFALGSIASGYQRVTDRLRPFYETQEQTNAAMRNVVGIARDARQALDPIAQLYSRIGQAAEDAGLKVNQSQLSLTVARAARLSGGDRDTQQAGITQFLQGFGSGTLNGDELKSIRENTFRLAKAIADGLGVPIAKLKELGAEGKLTPGVIAAALERSSAIIDLEFSRLPLRIDAALEQAGNNLSVFIGRMDSATGATEGLAKAIALLGANIPVVASGLASLGVAFAARSAAGPAQRITRAVDQRVQTFQAVRSGRATALTPEGRARGQALGALAGAGEEVRAASIAQQTARATIAGANERLAKIREINAAELENGRIATRAAEVSVLQARARVGEAQRLVEQTKVQAATQRAADVESLRSAKAKAVADLEAAKIAQANAQLNLSRITNQEPTGSRADRRRQEAVQARQAAVAEAELAQASDRVAAAQARVAASQNAVNAARRGAATGAQVQAAAGLARAEADLAAAMGNRARVQNEVARSGEETQRRGFAYLNTVQERVRAEKALADATKTSDEATGRFADKLGIANTASRAYNKSITLLATAKRQLLTTGQSLVGFLGGPWGAALTVATGLLTYFSTQTDEAAAAAERFKARQAEVGDALDKVGGKFAAAARQAAGYRLELAEADLAEKQKKRNDVGGDLAGTLTSLLGNVDRSTRVGQADARILEAMRRLSDQGRPIDVNRLRDIRSRTRVPEFSTALRTGGGESLGRQAGLQAVGLEQLSYEANEAQKNVAALRKQLSEPIKPAANLLGGTTGPTKTVQELKTEAQEIAEGGTAVARARAEYRAKVAGLDAELARRRKAGDTSFDADYQRGIVAAEEALRRVTDGQRAASAARAAGARATREAAKAERELNKAQEEANARAETLMQIRSRYDEAPRAVDQAEKDKRRIDDFFTVVQGGVTRTLDQIKVGDQIFTRADANLVKKNIDDAVRRPITDFIRDQGRELDVTRLILAGREDEAELLRQKVQLQDTVGRKLLPAEAAQIRRNLSEQRALNAQIEQRNRLIDNAARGYGAVREAVQSFVENPFDVGSIAQNLISSFRQQLAERITLKIFGGDPEQEFINAARGLDTSAANLTQSAQDLSSAASAIGNMALGGDGLGGPGARPEITDVAQSLIGDVDYSAILEGGRALQEAAAGVDDIVVVGKKLVQQMPTGRRVPRTSEESLNEAGAKFAEKLGLGKRLTDVIGKLGTFVSGASGGLLVNQGLSALGLGGKSQASQIGAALGGGLGKTLLGGENGLLAKGLGAISSKLGSFAGPLGSIAGGIVGSLVGGLFAPKAQKGTATVTGGGAGDLSAVGTSRGRTDAAYSLGVGVQGGVQKIADALGGRVGSFNVSIGTYKDDYRVNTNGRALGGVKGSGAVGFQDATAATEYAVLQALIQGAVLGVREGTQRLLRQGKSLDDALAKATSFEGVFKELRRYKDPVGAAVAELNLEFERLIGIFKEAGASSQEYADLEELYGLKRAEAIKNATNSTVDSLNDFIKGLRSGPDSPYSRRKTYDNASADLTSLRADLAAGKTVDSSKLIDALNNFKDASRELNGSRQSFFTDFEDVVALAEKAKANIESTMSVPGTLPASPFPDKVASDIAKTAAGTAAIAPALQELAAAIGRQGTVSGGSVAGSTFGYLPR